MRLLFLLLSAYLVSPAQITWTRKYLQPTISGGSTTGFPSPGYNGFLNDVYDPVSGRTWHYGVRGYDGNVSVTNGSNVVNWVSGDKFSPNWSDNAEPDYNCGNTNHCEIWLQSPTACGGSRCYVDHSNSDSQLILTSNYTGSTNANLGYSAIGTGIFSSDFFTWDHSAATFARMFGTGSLVAACILDTPTMPGDRHPYGQFVVDTTRNRLYLWGGAIAPCAQSPGGASPDITPRDDMYYMSLNADPTTNTWTKVTPARMSAQLWCASAVYSPDDDVIFSYGGCGSFSARHEVYCVSAGSPTAAQTAAGCTTANQWNAVTATGGPPTANEYPGLVYDTTNHKVILFGGDVTAGAAQNETWAYDIPTKTWTQRSSTNGPPTALPSSSPHQPGMAFNPNDGKVYVHHFDSTPGDYRYDYATDTWENLGDLGGPEFGATMTFDPITNRLAAFGKTGGAAEMWEGQVGSSGQFRILSSWPSGDAKWVEVAGVVESLTGGSTETVTLIGTGALSVPLTVQEALYGGATDADRTDEAFVMGVPLADGNGITSASQLGLTGTVVVGVDDLATDGTPISVDTGTGGCVFTIKKANHNGLDTVTCGGTAIVATSSSATRGLVVVGPDPTSGTTAGKVTCSPESGGSTCATNYTSANDSSSTCAIEINGPVYSVIKCTGTHKDGSANPYMQFTVRYKFFVGKPYVKATVILRNANYDTSATPSPDAGGSTFNTAYKGIKSYELRLGTNLTSTLNYTIADHDGTPTTGSITTETAYIYQGESTWMVQEEGSCPSTGACAQIFTSDQGYRINVNSSDVATGTTNQYPKGWFDIRESSGGKGLQIGMYQFAAQWPASLEFQGAEARIGLFSAYNTKNFYVQWPQWQIREVFLNFHTAALSDADGDFARYQHRLVARPTREHVNSTDVFPYDQPDPTDDDAYYVSAHTLADPTMTLSRFCWDGVSSPCNPDASPTIDTIRLNIGRYRNYNWGGGGPHNQMEQRWSRLQRFYARGFTGEFIEAEQFYRWFMEMAYPHTDGTTSSSSTVNGFTWRSRPHATAGGPELTGSGYPNMASLNASLGNTCAAQCWMDTIHPHWHGLADYYMMTGDETVKEMLVVMKDRYLNTDTFHMFSSGGPGYTRSIGIDLMGGSRFYHYLESIGDADADEVLDNVVFNFETGVKPDLCVSGYPSGCTQPTVDCLACFGSDPYGVSRVRGMPGAASMRNGSNEYCAETHPNGYFRIQSYFQPSILVEGLDYLSRAKGTGWADYWLARDLAYGISQWALAEMFGDDSSNAWCPGCGSGSDIVLMNGFRFGQVIDRRQLCPDGTTAGGDRYDIGGSIYDGQYGALFPGQNTMPYFWMLYDTTGDTSWSRKLKIQLARVAWSWSSYPADNGSYQMGALINRLETSDGKTLQSLEITGFTDNGSGNYTLDVTVPTGCSFYRVKYHATKAIVDWIGFEPLVANDFIGDPDTTVNWFAASNATGIPACGTESTTQSLNIGTGGTTGLTVGDFDVRAMAGAVAASGRVISGGTTVGGGTKVQ